MKNMTNLLDIMNADILDAPVKSKNAKSKAKELTAEEAATIELFKSVIDAMYIDCKDAANFDEVLKKHRPAIKVLNNKINDRTVELKLAAGYIKGFYKGYQVFYASLGNAKLKANQYGDGFLIWSIVGKITCNGKTAICSKKCYNVNKSYESNIKSKIRNAIFSQFDCFESIMTRVIKMTPYRKTFVRIHEDGDFYNMKYFAKWQNIAASVADENTVVMAYTKEPKLLRKINKINAESENMMLRFSIMEDTDAAVVKYVAKNKVPTYTVIGEKSKCKKAAKVFEQLKLANRCMDDCEHCKKCYTKHESLTNVYTKLR